MIVDRIDVSCPGVWYLRMMTIFTLVNVVDPEAMRICRTRLWNLPIDSSSTLRKHCAVLSLVTCSQSNRCDTFDW